MYSFLYDESETWKVWPNDMSLSEFNDGNSDIVISQIVRQLFDGVREQMNELKDTIQKEKSTLTNKMNELLTAFDSYRTSVQINEVFIRYLVFLHVCYINFLTVIRDYDVTLCLSLLQQHITSIYWFRLLFSRSIDVTSA